MKKSMKKSIVDGYKLMKKQQKLTAKNAKLLASKTRTKQVLTNKLVKIFNRKMKIIKKNEKIEAKKLKTTQIQSNKLKKIEAKKLKTKQILSNKLKKIYSKKRRLSPQEIRAKMVNSEEKRRIQFDLKLAKFDTKIALGYGV